MQAAMRSLTRDNSGIARPPHFGRLGRNACGRGIAVTLAMLAVLATSLALAVDEPKAPAKIPVTEDTLRSAITRGLAYLYSQQTPQGSLPSPHSREYLGGAEALAAWAMLANGQSPNDERVKKTLAYLKAQTPQHTYTRALRTIVEAWLSGDENRRKLGEDAAWLMQQQQRNGGWGYGPGSTITKLSADWTDGSNSQLAVLALRDAADAGWIVPDESFRRAERFWRSFRNEDGGWGYQPKIGAKVGDRPESHGSMTAAALGNYLMLASKLPADFDAATDDEGKKNAVKYPFADQIAGAINWLKANYAVDKVPKYVWMPQPSQQLYYLNCLVRAGQLAGLRTWGDHDYLTDLAAWILGTQAANGSWEDSTVDTSLALLCLAQVRAPVVITRLEVGDPTDVQDAANVARWFGRESGTVCAWQSAPLDAVGPIASGPLVYINSLKDPQLAKPVMDKLRQFIAEGGTLLVQAQPGHADAVAQYFLTQLSALGLKKVEVGPNHLVYTLKTTIPPDKRPKMLALGDQCRARVLILADDVSAAWNAGKWGQGREPFDLATNIVYYAAGGQPPLGRLAISARRETPPKVGRAIPLARLRYDGDFDVCPQAAARLSARLAGSLSIGVKELPAVDPAAPIDPAITLLWLTGNTPPAFTDAQLANIRNYLTAGGTLLIDPAIGRSDFRDAAVALAGKLVPDGLKTLPADHPLITGAFADGIGADLSKVRLARAGEGATTQPSPPMLRGGLVKDRLAVILSDWGLSCGVEGSPCAENLGYLGDDARKIVLNVLLFAAAPR
jgi:hypothetical protein